MRNHKARIVFAFTVLAIVLISGCTGIALNQKLVNKEGDWLTAGGSEKHQNVSYYSLEPQLDLKWSYDIDGGAGYSAIAITDAVVFVNSLAGDMFSFDISSGSKLGRVPILGKEANSTPLIIDNNVIFSYAGDNSYSLGSYDLQTGLTKWRIDLDYLQTSPVAKDGFVYVGSLNGFFYKVNIASDSVYWKFDAASQIHSTCAIEGDRAVFGADNGMIYCLNLGDGSVAWKFKTGAPVVAMPTIFENKIYIGSYDTNYYCLSMDSGTVVWKKNFGTKFLGGSSVYKNKDIIFGGVNGVLYSLNAADGSENWHKETRGTIGSSPLSSGDYIYFTSYDFNIYCVEGISGKELWKYELEGKSKTSPVIWHDFLVVAADKIVYCFGKNDLKK